MLIKKYLKDVLEIVFPTRCFYCHRVGKIICESCMKKVQESYLFRKMQNEWFDYMVCATCYKGDVKEQMHHFKFHEKAYLYQYFIEIALRNREVCEFLKTFDVITYVPMHFKKEQRRGYNQAKLLAVELGEKLNMKVIACLEKRVENKMQSSLTEQERLENVQNVFCFTNNVTIINKNIIIVDDIFTTGATMRNCAKILKENKAGKICAFTVSKT